MSFSLKRLFGATSLIACALALAILQSNIDVDPMLRVPFITLVAMLAGAAYGLLVRHTFLFAIVFAVVGFFAAAHWALGQFADV
jgi:hypothetical protein